MKRKLFTVSIVLLNKASLLQIIIYTDALTIKRDKTFCQDVSNLGLHFTFLQPQKLILNCWGLFERNTLKQSYKVITLTNFIPSQPWRTCLLLSICHYNNVVSKYNFWQIGFLWQLSMALNDQMDSFWFNKANLTEKKKANI